MDIKIETKEKSQVVMTGVLPVEKLEEYRAPTLTDIQKNFELPGFRKGNVPLNVIEKNVSEMVILEEMAERALAQAYPAILAENKVDAIGRPSITVTKLAKGIPLEFKIETAIMPKIDLPDYKKIASKHAKKKESVAVTDEEVDKVVRELQEVRAKESNAADGDKEKEVKEEDLPELTPEFAKSFGDFETIDALKAKIKENLIKEKESAEQEKKRVALVEEIIEGSKIDVPSILTEIELDKMLFRLKEDIKKMGLTFEGYTEHLGKTEEDIRKELFPDAEKRAKLELVMAEIANKENLKPDEGAVEKELGHLMEHYKDGVDPERAKAYVEQVLTNDKVFAFLESQ